MKQFRFFVALSLLTLLLLPSFFVFATTAPLADPTPTPGQVVIEGAPTFPQPGPRQGSALGLGLWCAVLLLLLGGLCYLVVNVHKQRKQALEQDRLVRPKLIISEGHKRE